MLPISIIIPCYNYGKYICETLESVEKETSFEDEIIVVDDGSEDGSRDLITQWIDGKNNFSYIYQDNRGQSAARNAGLDQAKAKYAYFLDADDRLLPGKLSQLKKAALQNPNAAMIIGGHHTYDEDGNEKHHLVGTLSEDRTKNFYNYAIRKSFGIANGGCVLVKTDIIKQYRYPENLRLSEDICLYSWIIANHPCITINETIVSIRKHNDSLRHQVDAYEKTTRELPSIIFDPKRLTKEQLKYRIPCEQHLRLSLFRAEYKAGLKRRARGTYLNAIRQKPTALFKWSYFSKFLRTFV